jgi:hypothetical protein
VDHGQRVPGQRSGSEHVDLVESVLPHRNLQRSNLQRV